MTSDNRSAEIYDMEDARARRQASELPGDGFEHVGAHLAAVRAAAGLTIAEAAAKTHIKERSLEAIELIDTVNLPSRPYAIGFVKSYAEFLGLDAQAIVDRFKQDAGFSGPATVKAEKFEAVETATEGERGELSFIAVAAILVFFVWCAYQITLTGGRDNYHQTGVQPFAETPAAESPAPPTGDVIDTAIVEQVAPIFPMRCLTDAKDTETVQVMFHITPTGQVTGERIARSSNACFDAAALNAIRRWRFEARKVGDAAKPVYDQRTTFQFQRPQ